MATRRISPPWDYLHDASVPSLESYELSRLNHAANIRREIGVLLDQWIEDNAQALLARWVREDRVLPQKDACTGDGSAQAELLFSEPRPHGEPPRPAERAIKISRRNSRDSSAL